MINIIALISIMSNLTKYEELTLLIQSKGDLSSFFNKSYNINDYKGIIFQALRMRDFPIVEVISDNVPLEAWFDKDFYLNKFRHNSNNNIDPYIFCMAIPKIRACFSPDEKGEFLYRGLVTRNDKMLHYASLDNDWEIVFPKDTTEEDLIGINLEPIAEYDIKSLDGKHQTKDCYGEFFDKIIHKFSTKGQSFYLLSSFSITIGQLKEMSERIVLNDADLIENSTTKSAIQKINQDLKDSIVYFKEKLHFNYWSDELKNEFIQITTRRTGFAKISTLADIKPFMDKLLPVIEYKTLDNDLVELPQPKRRGFLLRWKQPFSSWK